MHAFKTVILTTSVVALAGCASWDRGPICEKSHGWEAWSDTRCNPPETPRDIAAELAAAKQRNLDLEHQLAERNTKLAGLRSDLSEEMAKLEEAQRGLIRALRPQINKGDISVDLDNERLLISLASGYLFGSGEDQLEPDGAEALKRVGAIIKDYPKYWVAVDGHTDNVPIGSALMEKFPTNMELSEARAINAAKMLSEGGLRDITTHGYADTRPVTPNTTEVGRAKNRRVEVRVTADNHVAAALEHSKEAVAHGKQGHADALVTHAREALKHAEASGVKGPHLDEGIRHLREAVTHGLAPHADLATQHAETAITHLSQVK
jgi:flagellar motor protein MotB